MPTRNKGILSEIVTVLGDLVSSPAEALARLEEHYQDQLLVKAGDVASLASHAETLRLAIITPEVHQVLDYIGTKALAGIPIETTEEVINLLYPDRFIEP